MKKLCLLLLVITNLSFSQTKKDAEKELESFKNAVLFLTKN